MNIQTVLNQLNITMTDAQIGKVIGAPQSTVTRLRNGKHKTTFYQRAEAIKKLALEKGINPEMPTSEQPPQATCALAKRTEGALVSAAPLTVPIEIVNP